MIASLSVAGCINTTSPTPTPTPTQTAAPTVSPAKQLSMTAHTETPAPEVTAVYGQNIIRVNATIINYGAGTFTISTEKFFLTTTDGRIYQAMQPTAGNPASSVSDSGYSNWFSMHFSVNPGSVAKSIRYYDGTHDVTCNVK